MLEQKNKSRARVRLAVFFVLSVHVIGLMALLMQGCRKPQEPEPVADPSTNNAASLDMNLTNPAVTDTNMGMTVPPMTETNGMPTMTAPAGTEYTVMRGDNLTTIGKKFGVTPKQIQDANPGIVPTRLQVGQKLQIPAPTAIAPSTAVAPTAEMGGEYTVKSGDTLTKIASDHGTTVKALRSANNLTTDKIVVVNKLKIPAKTSDTTPVTQ
jgi:LysM repeat protein